MHQVNPQCWAKGRHLSLCSHSVFCSPHKTSPWYNCTGWLGVKHQLTYLLTTQNLTDPSFLLTKTTFAAHGLSLGSMIPSLSIFSSSLSTISLWAIGRRRGVSLTGWLFQQWAACRTFPVLPSWVSGHMKTSWNSLRVSLTSPFVFSLTLGDNLVAKLSRWLVRKLIRIKPFHFLTLLRQGIQGNRRFYGSNDSICFDCYFPIS